MCFFFLITLPTDFPDHPVPPPKDISVLKHSISSASRLFLAGEPQGLGGREGDWGLRQEVRGLATPAWALQSRPGEETESGSAGTLGWAGVI